MVSNNEIKIVNECRRKGLDSEEVLQIMQVTFELTENGILFDFDSIPPNTLSNYINYIFKQQGYRLDDGTLINGVYIRTQISIAFPNFFNPVYKFKVEIYSNSEKTYLRISKTFRGRYVSLNKKMYGENYSNSELNKIVNELKFLKPSVSGYLICDKCGSYYELKVGESPNDFDLNCECGGTLKYINNLNQLNEKLIEKQINSYPNRYLRASLFLTLFCLILCLLAIVSKLNIIIVIGIITVVFSLVIGLIYIKS